MIAWGIAVAVASAAAVLGGFPFVARPGRRWPAGDLATAWTLALGNAAVLALAAGLAGAHLPAPVLLLLLLAPGAAAAVWLRGRRRGRTNAGRASAPGSPGAGSPAEPPGAGFPVEPPDAEPPGSGPARGTSPGPEAGPAASTRALALAARAALVCALALLLVKVVRTPLWSWDHFAVWGVKARRMLDGGRLHLGFLGALYRTRTDHPLGLPMAWLLLTLGRPPTPAVFKALHALFALALVAVFRATVRGVTSSAPLADAAAAFLAASPLLWDSEAMGLAELPLALWTTVALRLILVPAPAAPTALTAADGASGPRGIPGRRRQALAAGLALGFLPWIKQEGLVLGLLLLAASPLLARRAGRREAARELALRSGPAAVLMAGALAMQRFVLPPGVGFFIGDWWHRGLDRLPQLAAIQRQCLSLLLEPDWLGFWLVLALLTAVATLHRNRAALALFAVVWCQVLIYDLTALFSYIPPPAHLAAAFFRICAALVPLGLLGMAACWASEPERALPPVT